MNSLAGGINSTATGNSAVAIGGGTANPGGGGLLGAAFASGNFSTVISGVIQKYANVVPTVTVASGSKMKVFFAEDVRLSPYLATRDLRWVRESR